MDAVTLLSDLIAQRDKVARADYANHPAFHQLTKAGLIEECGVVQSVHCDDCDHPHDAEVVFKDDRYGYHCPDLGFVDKDRSEVVAFQAKIATMVDRLADDLNCKRRKLTPVHGDTWRLGTVVTHADDVVIYFQPFLQDADDLQKLTTALAKEVKTRFGIILTAKGALTIAPYKTVSLSDCLLFDDADTQLRFDAYITAIAGLPEMHTGGRPNIYRANIQKIMIVRDRNGSSATGRNAEANGVLTEYPKHFPNQQIPSKSVVQRYVSEIRSGS